MATSLARLKSTICQACRQQIVSVPVRYNSNRTSVCRLNRGYYARMYPTVLVLPNGASLNIRYREPRKIIKLAVVFDDLTDEEKEARLRARKPKKKIIIEDEEEDDFDVDQYKYLWKKG
ncbi:hypothetical protein LOTGIDRAFT_204404 [Lottia gigantea]|uniref:39S ribosomal protein L55, mitochondrial n=1 Tax=Lottia gigantea TaxID=225164 RepID=V4BHI3_LOTGI|nr:hypothetical protein LOTGIDRAFT_204404 [Lottia gigantea]ESO88149.1 hypothetical protein LOTGIDRAFT_204404 [Lottia gigantea]